MRKDTRKSSAVRSPPKYLAIDLSRLHNLDGKRLVLHRVEGVRRGKMLTLSILSLYSFGLARLLFAACQNMRKARCNCLRMWCLRSS
jgi:hypothetical protein